MSEKLPTERERKLKALRVDLVGASPAQIAEQLIRVSPAKAAHVALLVAGTVSPAILSAASDRIARVADRIQSRPGETAGRLIAALMQEP
jgi:hypothetical protein